VYAGHKNTNVHMTLKVREIIFSSGAKHASGNFLGFSRKSRPFWPAKIKKICAFRIRGTLIVKTPPFIFNGPLKFLSILNQAHSNSISLFLLETELYTTIFKYKVSKIHLLLISNIFPQAMIIFNS
jgi:hypothetical protein